VQVKVKISEFSPLLFLSQSRIQKYIFFIVSDVMENGAKDIKTNTAQFIAIKYKLYKDENSKAVAQSL
jgi:hypothetical protein